MMKTVYVVKSQTSSGISKNYGSYHFPLTARPPTKMAEKIAAKNKNVSQIGLSTHNQDHEINPVAFNTASTSVKATIGSIPDRPDRLDFSPYTYHLENLIYCGKLSISYFLIKEHPYTILQQPLAD